MSIKFIKKDGVFHLATNNTSYIMSLTDPELLLNLYYGKRVEEFPVLRSNMPVCGMAPEANRFEHDEYGNDLAPTEFPVYGHPDFRTPAFHAEYENGTAVTELRYVGHEIYEGKQCLAGLPATYVEDDSEATSLDITLRDNLTGLEVVLTYTVFDELDVITKSVRAINCGTQKINIKSILSSTLNLFDNEYDFVHLHGTWARERHIEKHPLMHGRVSIESKRGMSSHEHSPFVALARPEATETVGDVYAMSFIYSGNFIAEADVSARGTVRVNMGINPFGFNWLLEPDEEFQAPEVAMTYSDCGFGKMSRTFHKLYRTRLCRGKYRDTARPVLINNWEATYFDFDEDKIVEIAKKAQTVGVELMVLDDGWFGHRDDDTSSLGDWTPYMAKLKNGITGVAERVEALGMKFGLWFEPEMISEDSELYKAHPDWCIEAPMRKRTPFRNQFTLDLTRSDVRNYIVEAVSGILRTAPISYVKWDMNRNITEIGSNALPPERQQELPHRYMLGLYEVMERIMEQFPDVLFEGCSSGGGRFDAGMLYYFNQYWTSDDTDAVERMYIQHGTSMVMPACTMGAHVSAVPNHQMGRTTPLKTRGDIAMMGQFGYELDLNKLSDEEISEVRAQIASYKDIREVVHYGDMYRLKSPFEGNCVAWEYVKDDRAVLMYATIHGAVRLGKTNVKLEGLCPDAVYREKETGTEYRGDYLMNVGLYFINEKDYETHLLVFDKQ